MIDNNGASQNNHSNQQVEDGGPIECRKGQREDRQGDDQLWEARVPIESFLQKDRKAACAAQPHFSPELGQQSETDQKCRDICGDESAELAKFERLRLYSGYREEHGDGDNDLYCNSPPHAHISHREERLVAQEESKPGFEAKRIGDDKRETGQATRQETQVGEQATPSVASTVPVTIAWASSRGLCWVAVARQPPKCDWLAFRRCSLAKCARCASILDDPILFGRCSAP